AAERPEAALAVYTELLARRPDRGARLRALTAMAEADASLNRDAAAKELLARIAEDAPPPGFLARALYRVARAHQRAGRRDAARESYRAALMAQPGEDVAPPALLALSR